MPVNEGTRHAILVSGCSLEKGVPKSLENFKDFLTSPAGGSWAEGDITVCGPMPWQMVQFLRPRLAEYGFLLVYRCATSRLSGAVPAGLAEDEEDYSGKLRELAERGGPHGGLYIEDFCDEIIPAEAACGEGVFPAMTAERRR